MNKKKILKKYKKQRALKTNSKSLSFISNQLIDL